MKTTVTILGVCALLAAVALADGPDTVTIGGLSHWFTAVEFSHADHVDYADDCTSCHHFQDAEDAGACDDCHGVEFDPSEPETPDLKLAYHLRCMGCHTEMDVDANGCVDCHERAALPDGPALEPTATD